MNILVLCLGNVNRSPLCAELLRRAGYNVDSAAVGHYTVRPAAKKTRDWAKKNFMIDLSHHRSKLVAQYHIDWADLIVFMTERHYERVCRFKRCPRSKVIFLGDYLTPKRSVPDPGFMSKDSEEFDRAMNTVVRATNRLISELKNENIRS